MDFLQCFSFSIRNGNYFRRNNGDGKVTSLDISENRVRKPSRCLLLFRGHFTVPLLLLGLSSELLKYSLTFISVIQVA